MTINFVMNHKIKVMRKIVFLLVFLVVSFSAFSQEKTNIKRSDLQGPAYKNYKPWKHNVKTTKVFTQNSKKKLLGPAYKNYKPWNDNSKKELVIIKIGDSERQRLKGPAYKNYKVWRKKTK